MRCRRRPSIRVGQLGPMHLSLFSPTGDPSKPGTGTTLLFDGNTDATRSISDRPDQSSTRRNRRSSRMPLFPWFCLQPQAILVCLVKRNPALQACNRTRNSQADGVPKGTRLRRFQACGAFLFLSVAGVHAWKTHRHTSLTLHPIPLVFCLGAAFHLLPPVGEPCSLGHLAVLDVPP
jgi:hypothetical protein